MSNLTDKILLLTGGTGSFGEKFTELLLTTKLKKLIIYSRDEHKQLRLEERLSDPRLRFLLGDVRDKDRLAMAMRDVDYVVHAAAYKQVQKCETDSFECVKTNIYGTQNVIQAALDTDVNTVLLISTDKAVQPINLYGASKMVAERLIIAANGYRGNSKRTKFCATRYGNVAGTRSTVVPIFFRQKSTGICTVTDRGATRFWISLKEANQFVMDSLGLASSSEGGEIYVPSISSVRIPDVASCIGGPDIQIVYTGNRPGDKLHETLITEEEIQRTYKTQEGIYVIQPLNPIWPYVRKFASLPKRAMTSENNRFLNISEIRDSIKEWFKDESYANRT